MNYNWQIVKNQAHHDNEIKLKQLLKQVKEDHGLSTKVQQQNHQEFVKRMEAEHEYQNETLREFKALIMVFSYSYIAVNGWTLL